jgi:GntR family transcriptional repressor for pyruvate dehydrogenase complex
MGVITADAAKASPGSANILQAIMGLVQDCGLKVGDQLPSIRELADRLDVKQTAVRDALLKADAMGLVKVLPRAGAFLRATAPASQAPAPSQEESPLGSLPAALIPEEHNPFHLLDARRLIEVELIGRAAERRLLEDLLPVRRPLEAMLHLAPDASRAEYVGHDIRFHLEAARLSGNLVLFGMQQTLMELLRPHLDDVPCDLERRAITDRSHVAIYEALVAGDAGKARSEMRQHLSLAYDSLLLDVQEPPTWRRISPSTAG